MDEFPGGSLLAHFADLNDPRMERTKKHKLIDIIAICGVICGADNWVEIACFGEGRETWMPKRFGIVSSVECKQWLTSPKDKSSAWTAKVYAIPTTSRRAKQPCGW